jgi:predicted negative regulator of RcsB-dependent stress response
VLPPGNRSFRTIRHRYKEPVTLTRLGDTHHAAGDHDAARHAWEQAQALFEDLQHPDAEPVRVKLKALACRTPSSAR